MHIVVTVAATVVSLLAPVCPSSPVCTCGRGRGVPQAVRLEIEGSAAVFLGTVVRVEVPGIGNLETPLSGDEVVTVALDRRWKGPARDTLVVRTPMLVSMCGYDFEEGRTYLIYARENAEGTLYTTRCSFTVPVDEAARDLRILRRLFGPG